MHHTPDYTLKCTRHTYNGTIAQNFGYIRGAISAHGSDSPKHLHSCSLTLTGAGGSTGRADPSSSLRNSRGHVRKHAQLRGALRALNAYLSIVPSFSDGGSGLSIVGAGCCGEGSSDKPATFAKKSAAYLTWRRKMMQRSQAASSDGHASLPAPGPLTDAAAIRGAHHPAPSSPRLGAGGQEFD
jgi:hypothetical protein